jgi:hypothetical protein
MAQKKQSSKSYAASTVVSTNGSSEDHRAFAETVAPQYDLLPETAAPEIDLDAALGDEDALRHELLDEAPLPIEVRVPRKREFFAVHPTYRRLAEIVEYAPEGKLQRDYYLVAPEMKPLIEDEDKRTVELVFCQSFKSRGWFWWPINLDPDGTDNSWNRSSRKVADEIRAKGYWGRRVSQKAAKQYITKWAPAGHTLPTWPEQSKNDLLREAFIKAERYIDNTAHPVYLELEGAA